MAWNGWFMEQCEWMDKRLLMQRLERTVRRVAVMFRRCRVFPKVLNKQNLSRYKHPEMQEKEEGYDGIFEWDPSSDVNVAMIAEFRLSVNKGDQGNILQTFDTLGVAASEHQLTHITSLLMDRTSAEPLKEALLTAICIGSRPMVEFILSLFYEFPYEEFCGCTDSIAFLPHITPIILAGLMNNFSIMECLLLRGHSIDIPHHRSCKCDFCSIATHSNMGSVRKVDVLRAVSSEAFLWLSTEDPFVASCNLAKDLRICMNEDDLEFTEIYKSLYDNVQLFALRMIEQCWKVDEIDVFLSQDDAGYLIDCSNAYPRIRYAIDCQMKPFVASVNVQLACSSMWTRGWGHYGSNLWRDLWRIFRHFLFYPLFAMIYVLSCGTLCTSFNVPLARFTSYLASYLSFLVFMLFIQNQKLSNGRYERSYTITDPVTLFQFYTYLYVIGFTIDRFLEYIRRGSTVFWSLWWRYMDVVFIIFNNMGMASFALGFVSTKDDQQILNRRNWHSDSLFQDCYWAAGTVFAFWKLFYFFQLVKGLGPKVVSISRSALKVCSYLSVMLTIMISFSIGISMLAGPYAQNKEIDSNGVTKEQEDNYSQGVIRTTYSLFWSFFGYISPSQYSVAVGNSGPEQDATDHYVVSFTIENMLAIYHIVLIVTVLNLMISMLVRVSDQILDNEEFEFKFIRACIYSEYLNDCSAVPPPFNIIWLIILVVKKCISSKYSIGMPEIVVLKETLNPTREKCEKDQKVYKNLLVKIFERFCNTHIYHFKTVYREDNMKTKASGPHVKLAFMNSRKRIIEKNPPMI